MNTFYSGATIKLDFTLSDFPSPDWTASLILKNATETKSFGAIAGASGAHDVVISSTDSSNITPGIYSTHYRVENTGGEVSFETGPEICILGDPSQAGDQRTQAEKDLEAVDNAIRKKIEGGAVEEYEIQTTVGRRRLKSMTLEDLRNHRKWVLRKLNAERVKMGKKPLGNNQWKKIRSHLGNQSHIRRRRY